MTPTRIVPSTTSHKHEALVPTLEVFARLGFHDLDLNLWHLIEGGVTLDVVRGALAAGNQHVRIVSGGWCDFFDPPPGIETTMRSVERQVALTRALGVRELRLFLGRLRAADYTPARRDVIVENLSRLSDQHHDITFVFENHGHEEASARPEMCADILSTVGRTNIRMNFDPINAEFAGFDCRRALDVVRPFIAHVHLKGLSGREYAGFGEGTVNLEPVIGALIDSGYAGLFTVEYEGRFDRTLRLYESVHRAEAAIERAMKMPKV